jgi:acetoin utilization deacetylase AcuC-like enzyme
MADMGMGFCLFNNIVLAALHSRVISPDIKRIAIVGGIYIHVCMYVYI